MFIFDAVHSQSSLCDTALTAYLFWYSPTVERETASIHAVSPSHSTEMQHHPLQGQSFDISAEEEEEENSQSKLDTLSGNTQLDPELNEVLEKLLTPKSTYESLALPSSDRPDVDTVEESDRFDEEDLNGEFEMVAILDCQ